MWLIGIAVSIYLDIYWERWHVPSTALSFLLIHYIRQIVIIFCSKIFDHVASFTSIKYLCEYFIVYYNKLWTITVLCSGTLHCKSLYIQSVLSDSEIHHSWTPCGCSQYCLMLENITQDLHFTFDQCSIFMFHWRIKYTYTKTLFGPLFSVSTENKYIWHATTFNRPQCHL